MCAMKFSHELRYAAPADDVHAMLTEQEFRERVCDANRAVAHRVEVTPTGDRTRLLVHCLIGAFGGASGTVIYDDISLTEIPGASGAKGLLAELATKADSAGAAAAKKKFTPDPEVHKRGGEIYGMTCVACHQPSGAGLEGAFPPLDGSDWATGDPSLPIRIVTGGLQGPVKVLGLEAGVNITVGLPVIRTSVDHGTAFDIAGKGVADERSLLEALRQGAELATRRA